MSSSRSVVLSGVLAAVIAAALIVATISAGVLTKNPTTFVPSTTTITGGNSPPQVSGTTTGQSSSQSSSQQGAPSPGTLAILMTDPPTVPDGVTHIYATYDNLAIHITGAGNDSGWTKLSAQGELDLMSLINVTQTIAAANVSAGIFNGIAFNVSSVTVTYQGANYTAALVYQEHTLVAWIAGGIAVTSGHSSAAVIDLTPTVLLLGAPSNPSFAFIPEARAYTIPAQSFSTAAFRVGHREDIHDQIWWKAIESNSHFEITGVQLTPSTLSITVQNTGQSSVVFQLASLTSESSLQGGMKNTLPTIARISELFVVEPNASLAPFTFMGEGTMAQMIAAGGYLLPPQASVTFAYTGNVTIGMLQSLGGGGGSSSGVSTGMMLGSLVSHVVPGQRYIVTIRAAGGLVAQAVVVASG